MIAAEMKLKERKLNDADKQKIKIKIKNKIKRIKIKIRTKIIKILTVFPDNCAKFDNIVVDAIKLILLNYSNFSNAKIVVKDRKGKVNPKSSPNEHGIDF